MPDFTRQLPQLTRTVRIPVERFGKYFEAFGKAATRSMFTKSIPAASQSVRQLLETETIKRGIFYKKRFARGWRVRKGMVSGMSATVYNKQPYAIVIEKGRRAGRRPPPSRVLIPWVMDKLGVSAKDAPRVAFLVARAIGLRGIPARPILGNVGVQFRIRRTLSGTVFWYMQEGMGSVR